MIEQVVMNLIKNSIEAMDGVADPRIEVSSFMRKGKTVIRVSDNGKGIIPEAMERVFILFYTTKTKGSGIGLNLCRQIMTRHQGTIVIDSVTDSGTVAEVVFP